MKKLLCAILIFATAFGLISCSQSKYEPRESTEEELRVVMTVSVGDTEYDIKYQKFLRDYIALEDTAIQMIKWSDFEVKDKEQLVLKMADSLIESSQRFVDCKPTE